MHAAPARHPAAELATAFPGLQRLLGDEPFAQLAALAAAHSHAQGVPPDSESGVPAGAFVHGLLLHGDVPAPDGVPRRLLGDVAAVEWAVAELRARAAALACEPRLTPDALAGLPPDAALRPARGLRLLPCAFRVAGWLRDVHEGREPLAPRRGEQVVAAHVPPSPLPDAAPVTWWNGLSHAEGRVLSRAALGTPPAELLAEGRARGWLRDEAQLREWLDGWVREGWFAGLG